jgi:hypothetical protein
MDPVREDLREIRSDLKAGISALQESVKQLGDKLSSHALEDADREGKVTAELGMVRSKLEVLASQTDDRQRFLRGWIGGLVAIFLAAGVGFIIRNAIDSQIYRAPVPEAQR